MLSAAVVIGALWVNDQGPVVQSVISLTKSLVEDSLSLRVLTKSIVAVFLAEKLLRTFTGQKFFPFFRQKLVGFLHYTC